MPILYIMFIFFKIKIGTFIIDNQIIKIYFGFFILNIFFLIKI